MSDDDALGGFGPTAVVPDAAVGADGADDAVGGGRHGLRLLHYKFEAASCAGAAFFEQAVRAGVAVDGAALAKAVFVGKEGGAFPVEEALLDGVAVGVLADAASGRVMAEANLLFVFFLARSIHGPARSGKRDFPRQFVKTPTLRQHRGGWGTRKFFFACGAFLERDYDGKRKFDFGFLKIFDLCWLGETGIVDHVVFFFLARSKLAMAGRRDGVGRDNLLYLINFVFCFKSAGLTGWE